MYALWFIFRVLLPIYLMVLIWTKVANGIDAVSECHDLQRSHCGGWVFMRPLRSLMSAIHVSVVRH